MLLRRLTRRGIYGGQTVMGRILYERAWSTDMGPVTPCPALPPGSHIVKLSHTLRQPGAEGEVIQYEDLAEPSSGGIPADCVVRPLYRKGAEIVVYRDATHLHSAPDFAHRESLWRLM